MARYVNKGWQAAAPALVTVCSIVAAFEIGFLAIIFTAASDRLGLKMIGGTTKILLTISWVLSIAAFIYSSEKITDALESEDENLYLSTFLYYNSGLILAIIGAELFITNDIYECSGSRLGCRLIAVLLGGVFLFKYVRDTYKLLITSLELLPVGENRECGFKIFVLLSAMVTRLDRWISNQRGVSQPDHQVTRKDRR